MQQRLAAGEFDAREAQRLGLAYGRFKVGERQGGVAAAIGIELGSQPAVAACQIAAFGQVKVNAVQ